MDQPGAPQGGVQYGLKKKSNYEKLMDADLEDLLKYNRYANLCNAICVISAGVVGMIVSFSSFAAIFSCVYTIIFGCILCCFEIRMGNIKKICRKYFGFLFTHAGRLAFLFLLCTVSFGVMGGNNAQNVFSLIAAIFSLLNFIMSLWCLFCHPSFKDVSIWSDPTQGYLDAEQHAKAGVSNFVQNNPDLAQQAINSGINYASQNPDVMKQGIKYAANNPGVVQSAMA